MSVLFGVARHSLCSVKTQCCPFSSAVTHGLWKRAGCMPCTHAHSHARTQRLHTIYTKSSCLLSLSWCNSSYAGCHHEAGHPRRRTKTSINAYFHITRHTCPKCTAGSEWSLIWTSAMKSDISTHQWFTCLKVTIVQVSKDASPGLPQQQQQHDSLSS